MSEVQAALNACQADISSRFVEYKEEIRNTLRQLEGELFMVINKKANLSDMDVALNSKADAQLMQNLIHQKINVNDFEEIRRALEKQWIELDEKLSVKEFDNNVLHTKQAMDLIQKDLILKANIKDVCTLIDTKASK